MRSFLILTILLGGCATPPQKSVRLVPDYTPCMMGGGVDEQCAMRVDADFTLHREYKLDLLQQYQDAFGGK